MKKSLWIIPLLFAAVAAPVSHAQTLFTDLGTGTDVYSIGMPYVVTGSGSLLGTPFSQATEFPVAGTGSESVSDIDLAVTYASSPDTFYASIWTDVSGTLGSEVAGAYWSLSTSEPDGSCCALVSVTGITGVTLTGDQDYFMVLGPLSFSDDSYNLWSVNSHDLYTDNQYSNNGGTSWTDVGVGGGTEAFDVLGGTPASTPATIPEPGTGGLMLIGIIGLVWVMRKRISHVLRLNTPTY